jgi:hypothetical protein
MAQKLPSQRRGHRSVLGRLHEWRNGDPTSPRKRLLLARSLEGVVRELHAPVRLPGASPLNRIGVRPYEDDIAELSARLADLERPVTPAGMRLVHEFVTSGASPLYDRSRAAAVPWTIWKILEALEPR